MIEPGNVVIRSCEADQDFDALVCEVSAKLEAGESVDFGAIAAEHPKDVDRLRKLLPTLQAMAELGHADAALPAVSRGPIPSSEPTTGVLGRLMPVGLRPWPWRHTGASGANGQPWQRCGTSSSRRPMTWWDQSARTRSFSILTTARIQTTRARRLARIGSMGLEGSMRSTRSSMPRCSSNVCPGHG